VATSSSSTPSNSSQAIPDNLWQAITNRQNPSGNPFFYAVKTTGIFCRPTCASRVPRRQNVRIFSTPADALTAGYRPCKRCKPLKAESSPELSAVLRACHQIQSQAGSVRLADLAAPLGMSAPHFQRLFKKVLGLTPAEFARAVRSQNLQDHLSQGNRSITAIAHATGYPSGSSFYAVAKDSLGMTPTQFQNQGSQLTIRYATGHSTLGEVLVAQTDQGICSILLGDDADSLIADLHARFKNASLEKAPTSFSRVVQQVIHLVENPALPWDLPLDIRGTAFQQRVWKALRKIPAGTTWSYQKLARHLGIPTATRAVASACGANAVAVAIPCHRIVRTSGALAGYRWGLERKKELLARESQSTSSTRTGKRHKA